MDKTKIDSTEFIPFKFAKAYSYAMLKISVGQHLVECTEGLLSYSYGVGFWESYFYLSGFGLPNFNPDFKDSVVNYDCQNQRIKLLFRSNSLVPLKSYDWDFGDGYTATGNPVQHIFQKIGNYQVKLYTESYDHKKDTAIRTVKVGWPEFDPVRDKIICGKDSVTFEEKNPFFKHFKWQDSTTKNYLTTGSNGPIWVRATDASGYCVFVDSGKVKKIDINTKLFVDSIATCFRFNKFNFKDSVSIIRDSLYHKAWVMPWNTYWDSTNIDYHFLTPANHKVYFDVYTKYSNCKARYPINVSVHPMPNAANNLYLQDYCSNKPFLITDNSTISDGIIKKVKWLFDDSTTITSDSLKTYKTLLYDKNKQDILRFVKHIAISEYNCTDTVKTAVLIWPKPEVNFTLTNPDTIKCLNAARWTFTSQTKVDNDTFSLYWNSGNGKTGTDYSLKNVRYYSTGKFKVTLKALSPFGCHDSISKIIEVWPDLKAGFSVNDSVQCRLDNLFNFKDTSATKSKLNYSWTLGNGNTSTKKEVDSIHYKKSGLIPVKLNISNPYEGCKDSITNYIRILQDPKAIIATNSDTQCYHGNHFNFYNKSVFYQPYLSSQWTTVNLSDTNFNLLSFTSKDTGDRSIRLIVYDAQGCKDTAYKMIRIMPHPVANLFINDSIQCFENNDFIFSTSKQNTITHSWKIDNNYTVTNTKDSLSFYENNAGLHQVRIISSNAFGCSDSMTKTYRLLDPPKADFIINNDSQCLNANHFLLTDHSIAKNDKLKEWIYFANNLLYTGSPNSPDIIFNTEGKKTIQYLIKTAEGCIDSLQKDIFIFPNTNGMIKGDTVCLYDEASIKFIQTAGNPIQTWNWDLGDGHTAKTSTVYYSYSKVGNYKVSVQVTDSNACKNTLTLTDAVLVNPLPDASFTYAEKPFTININKAIFKPNYRNATHYLWRWMDGTISNKDTAELIINKVIKGTISLTVTNENGCKDSSSIEINLTPEIFNAFIPNAISPNNDGHNDFFKIEGLENADNFKLRIMSRWGEQIFYSNDITTAWDGTYQGKNVPIGLYDYYITFTYINGKQYELVGLINVLR